MKIVAGLGAVEDYQTLVQAGADEVFFGYVPHSWNKKYGNLMPLNRREVLYYHVQIGTFSEMKILSKMMNAMGVPVTITFNALYYTEKQYEEIAEMISQLMAIGFTRYIIADIGLLIFLRQKGIDCNIHISGEMGEVNRLTFSILKPYDISRMIFHRQNTIQDIKSCIAENQNETIEYEAFFLNERCQFHGGFCNSMHCDELTHMCRVPYQLVPMKNENDRLDIPRTEPGEIPDVVGGTGCGLCALPLLKDAGVTHLKIVGRGNFVECMTRDIKYARRAIQIMEEDTSSYQQRIIELLGGQCSHDCYYV